MRFVKERRKIPRSRILYGYVISYISVALIALAFLSILLAWQISENMRAENLRVTRDKLYMAAEDMQTQVETMCSMAYQIASIPDFRSINFEKNKYNEAEMVERLTQFRSFSVLSNYFFLKYQGNNSIYTSEGTTLPIEVYVNNNVEEAFREDILEQIDELSNSSRQKYALMKSNSSTVLLICPLKRYAVAGVGLDGCLCLEINGSDVESRVEQIAGLLNGMMQIYYDDVLLSGGGEESLDLTWDLEGVSSSGNASIMFRQSEDNYFRWSRILSGGVIAILIGVSLLLLGISVFFAWRHYIPIRKLLEKYGHKEVQRGKIGNELADIDSLIDTLQQKDEKNNQRIQEQYTVLREQTLRLISSGGYLPGMDQRLEILNIHLPGPIFGKIKCAIAEWNEEANIGQEIEDLANEETTIYVFREREKTLTVLLSLEEEYQIHEFYEAILALLEARSIDAAVSISCISHDLTKLQRSYGREADGESWESQKLDEEEQKDLALQLEEESEEKKAESSKESAAKRNRKAKQAVQYINENCLNYDLSLDSIARELHVTSTYLCRLIKQETGIGYKEYLTKLRMEEAKRLLKDPDAAIGDVCQKIGYTNVSHFIKIFQKYEGTTPAKYRNQG